MTEQTKWTFAGHELTLSFNKATDEWHLYIDGKIAATTRGKRPNRLWCHAMAFRLY